MIITIQKLIFLLFFVVVVVYIYKLILLFYKKKREPNRTKMFYGPILFEIYIQTQYKIRGEREKTKEEEEEESLQWTKIN